MHPRHHFGYSVHTSAHWKISPDVLEALPAKHLNRTADTPLHGRELSDVLCSSTVKEDPAGKPQPAVFVESLQNALVVIRPEGHIGIQDPHVIMRDRADLLVTLTDRTRL